MKKTIYTLDSSSTQLTAKRTFNAPLELVWKAWTVHNLLDEWWAPKPWKTETKSMNFSNGGHWFYSMNGPGGEQHWTKADFSNIVHLNSFTSRDCFTDSAGTRNEDLPGTHWDVKFRDQKTSTEVEIKIRLKSVEDLNTLLEMGFKEGFSDAHQNLDELLKGML